MSNPPPGPGAAPSTSITSVPVKVPSSAASYTPATLDPDLRSQINMVLIRDGHVSRIQERLMHVLQADASNWPAAVQAHALTLLRTGAYTSFPALLERVLDDIRTDTREARDKDAGKDSKDSRKTKPNGVGAPASAGTANSLALPPDVLEEALRATRESLEMVCEIEE